MCILSDHRESKESSLPPIRSNSCLCKARLSPISIAHRLTLLESTLMDSLVSVENKGFTKTLSTLESALTKNRGGTSFKLKTLPSPRFNVRTFRRANVPCLSLFVSHSCALFCAFLHSRKTQPFSFHAFPHSLPKTPRGKAILLTSHPSSQRSRRLRCNPFFFVSSLAPYFIASSFPKGPVAFALHSTADPLCGAPPRRTMEVHSEPTSVFRNGPPISRSSQVTPWVR
jgi:hypothetical protein